MFKFKSLFLNVVAVLSVSMLLVDVALVAAPQTRSCKQRSFCGPRKKRRCCRAIRGERGEPGEQGPQGESGTSTCACTVTSACPNGLGLIVGTIDVSTAGSGSGSGFTYVVSDSENEVTITFEIPCGIDLERTIVATAQHDSFTVDASIVVQDGESEDVIIRFSGGTQFVHFIAACCQVTPIP